MVDELAFVRLWDLYAPLLTERQKAIADLHFNYDLSLGEIAEQMAVSRQSVYDCLQTTKSILAETEEKLGLYKAQQKRKQAAQAYLQAETEALTESLGEKGAEVQEQLSRLRAQFGVEI
ncbi:MAG: hypothetical protein IJX18_03935 [Clostridia bacterium]|nr:hypothetical protein [Clostridia bacterium]